MPASATARESFSFELSHGLDGACSSNYIPSVCGHTPIRAFYSSVFEPTTTGSGLDRWSRQPRAWYLQLRKRAIHQVII
jgi:hypothetical protein